MPILSSVLKKTSLHPNDLKNYRHVSNLPLLSKIIERSVLFQLNDHLTSNKLFSPLQSAYKPDHSTETALLKIVNDLLTALDNGKICILTLLDLSATFDTIDHNNLLHRLDHTFVISDSALSWFRSCLSDPTEIVTVNGLRSDEASLSFGVPLGSVLGPFLFVLYTQPMFELIKKHSIQHQKNLGVTLDCNLNMTQHVLNICRSAYIELRQLSSIRHLLTAQATQTLVCAFVLSRLDYCNCLLTGCPVSH